MPKSGLLLATVPNTTKAFGSERVICFGYSGKRHSRTEGVNVTSYYWDAGYSVVNESDGTSLTRTYVGRTLGQMDYNVGLESTTWRFYFHDHLGSTRRMRNAAGASIAQYEFEPYGNVYATTGTATTTRQFAGLDRDPSWPGHYAPFRWYNSGLKRWTTRDPLGMVDGTNVYTYVRGNPVRLFDRLGLRASIPRPPRPSSKDCALKYAECVDDADFLKAQRDRDLEARHKACFYGIAVNCSYTCSVYCTAATGWWTLGTSLLVCIPTCITGCTVGAQMACDAFLLKEQKRIDTMWEEDCKRCREDLDKCLTDYEDKCDAYEDYRDILN